MGDQKEHAEGLSSEIERLRLRISELELEVRHLRKTGESPFIPEEQYRLLVEGVNESIVVLQDELESLLIPFCSGIAEDINRVVK